MAVTKIRREEGKKERRKNEERKKSFRRGALYFRRWCLLSLLEGIFLQCLDQVSVQVYHKVCTLQRTAPLKMMTL